VNIMSLFTDAKPAPSKAAERFRQYRTTGNGKIEVYLPPQRGDELRNKLIKASTDRDVSIDSAAGLRDRKLKEAKAAYDAAVKEIERENRQYQHKANVEFDEIEAALLAEYSAPLSSEQIALLTTKPGEVVRMPAAPTFAAPVAEPQAV
jgi:hypothetical protein